MIFYYFLMAFSFTCLWFSSYYLLRMHGGYNILLYTNYILYCMSLLLVLVVSQIEPGYLKTNVDNFDFI